MRRATITEAKNGLSALIDRVKAGETVLITDRGVPVARIEPATGTGDDMTRWTRVATEADPRDLPGNFAHRVVIDVRFADTDAMGHVNNAVYLTYCEMARIRYWTDVTGDPVTAGQEGAESLILAEARITYRAPVFHGEQVTVESRATHLGRSSFTLEHRLTAAGPGGIARLVAVSSSVLVRYDYGTGRPVALGSAFVAAIEGFEGRPLRSEGSST